MLEASIEDHSIHIVFKAVTPMLSRDFSTFFQKKAPLHSRDRSIHIGPSALEAYICCSATDRGVVFIWVAVVTYNRVTRL
jgi:hypothetical protein